ncbi:MAG: PqqD family protein [Bacteroidales bacterium]|nr:PqqD family protein [Bacteroidales bacterium]
MNIFQRRKILKNINALDLIPVRRHEHDITDENKVVLVVPKFEKNWMRKFFIAPARNDNFKIFLDHTGSKVWLKINGVKTSKDIADELLKEYPDMEESYDRVLSFISMLYEQRYITFQQLLRKDDNM